MERDLKAKDKTLKEKQVADAEHFNRIIKEKYNLEREF